MSRRTQTYNAFETGLSADLQPGALTMQVESTEGLDTTTPMYFVIEPDVPTHREWMKASVQSAGVLVVASLNDRWLTGSNLDKPAHPGLSKVRAVFSMQLQADLFSDIIENEAAIRYHAESPDPHPQYLEPDEADDLYLQLTGAKAMTGPLTLADGMYTQPLHAVPKGYVDGADTAAIASAKAYSDSLDHHARYTDAEAVAAVGTPWAGQYLPLHGTADAAAKWVTARKLTLSMTGSDVTGSGSVTWDGSANATLSIAATVQNDSHTHDGRYYTESEANARYLSLTGGKITGNLTIEGNTYIKNSEVSGRMHKVNTQNWDIFGFKNIQIQDSTSAPTGGQWGDVIMNYNYTAAVKGLWVNTQFGGWIRIATI